MKQSLYDKVYNRLTIIKNTGFNYEGRIFEKTMSPYLFADPNRKDILTNYEKIIFFLIEKVKMIKTFYNYTVPKNYRNLN